MYCFALVIKVQKLFYRNLFVLHKGAHFCTRHGIDMNIISRILKVKLINMALTLCSIIANCPTNKSTSVSKSKNEIKCLSSLNYEFLFISQ